MLIEIWITMYSKAKQPCSSLLLPFFSVGIELKKSYLFKNGEIRFYFS